jgi:hypothetical protein
MYLRNEIKNRSGTEAPSLATIEHQLQAVEPTKGIQGA